MGELRISLGLVDLSRLPSGTFFRGGHPGSEMSSQNDQTRKNDNENFNLDFFYTINSEAKSVIGFEKSTFVFKNNAWDINPDAENTDKITFDLKNDEFNFSQFKLVSGEQKVEFTGSLKGDTEKILLADFTKVKLQSFLPEIDSLALKGKVSGNLDFVQMGNVYSPEAVLIINDFETFNDVIINMYK